MNRKTNIFYTEGDDSKFLTFDNYTEALTGDILATNQKLWPSRFLCFYIENLDGATDEERDSNKKEFINKYLVPYYENKMAFLRDNISNSEDLSKIHSLNYLLSLIYFYAGKLNDKEYTYISDVENDLKSNTYYSNTLTKDKISLNYISDIIEQDYNGTYADIICTISTALKYKATLIFHDSLDPENNIKEYNHSNSKLYGWEDETNANILPYVSQNLVFDEKIDNKNVYYMNSLIDTIKIEDLSDEEKTELKKLKFNVIIPVFDSKFIDKIKSNDRLTLDGQTNVPLGIYFTGKPVELELNNGIFNTNWSLLISMQFKAFPYSFGITHNFDDSDAIKDAYVTFAEILAKQNSTISNFAVFNEQILTLQKRINLLESSIKSLSTTQNIDDINLNIMKFKEQISNSLTEMNDKIDELEKTIDANKLRWKVKNN